MIPAEFDYVRAQSVEEAVRHLRENGEDAKLLAGGHSLLPLMKLRLAAPSLLVDIGHIPGLHGVQENGEVRIGALTTHSLLARAGLGVVSDAASLIADPQVRNRGTIGGSLAHGDPASDLPAVVLALDGVLVVEGENAKREIAAADFFQDYLMTALEPHEVITEIRLAAPTLLVDLRRVEELRGVNRSGGVLTFGSMVRHHAVATGGFGLPSAAAATIADQQVRNMGTIGGTLAHGDPASDLPAILLAHEGSVILRGPNGEREVAAADFFEDYLTTVVAEDEIMTEVRIPALEGYGYGYEKFNRRQEDWAMVAVSALVKKGPDGYCEDVRIGLTHMSSVPLRATAAENALRGGALDANAIAAAAEQAAEGTDPPGDLNASEEYKRHLARVLCRRALTDATA